MKKLLLSLFLIASMTSTAQQYQPAKMRLTTFWGEEVKPDNTWSEYPRPQMERKDWLNLNGLWEYAILEKGRPAPASFDGKILVPFCIESSLSGVGKSLMPTQELWYKRSFKIPVGWTGRDVVLHFDAVDWETKLWVNGKRVGDHKGGSDPFSFNISPFLNKTGEQVILMSVWDPTDTELQPRGKQVLDPKGIWYTAVSGIWQTAWLEPISKKAITSFVPEAIIEKNQIQFTTAATGISGNEKLRFQIRHKDKLVKDTTASFNRKLSVTLPDAKRWSPKEPNIYTVSVELKTGTKTDDQFNSYFAMRKIALGTDQHGYTRLMLNDEFIFQYGTLDQGWWPDGLLTPPSDAAMLFDMVKLKEMGFNMIRKHIKVEPSRYYYHADTMGMLLWQDMPSGFAGPGPSHVAFDAEQDWVRPEASAKQFEIEWRSIMDHLRFFPSIIMWVPLNEGWGQYDTKRIAKLTRDYDPSRLVDAPSGWTDRGVGDVNDAHQYPGPGMEPPSANKGRAIVLGEFGGLGLVVKDHIWDPGKRNWGYKTYHESSILVKEYQELIYNMQLMIPRGLSAAIYTQTTDVEGEVNGLMTYDRRHVKIPVSLLQQLHAPLFQPPAGKISFINKASETSPNQYRAFKGTLHSGWAGKTDSAAFTEQHEPVSLKKEESVYAYQEINIDKVPAGLGLKLFGFGDAKIYINGTLVWEEDKIRTKRHYDDINLTNKISLLKAGKNIIAVECLKATQDTRFDFGLYRLDR